MLYRIIILNLIIAIWSMPLMAQLAQGGISRDNHLQGSGEPVKIEYAPGSVIVHNNAIAQKMIKNPAYIYKMEAFVNSAIAQKAFPGCQIVAIKDGVSVYSKSFGTLDYNANHKVKNNTLYDIASVTKVVATTLAIMKLYEEGKIILTGKLGAYVPETRGSQLAFIEINDLLTHQAGLRSWVPFYKQTLDEVTSRPKMQLYQDKASNQYPIPVAKGLFGSKTIVDTVWKTILNWPLENKGKYVYSDWDMLFLQRIVEESTGMPLDMYVNMHFYEPLELKHIQYNPWKHGLSELCAPTENDKIFRFQTVRGYVHDQAAAMLGGVAGHAGLFSNAEDLSVIMQMLNKGGTYGGKRYFKKSTIDLFSGYRSGISRRGYGFDKPDKKAGKGGPAADVVSKRAFGHQGFTGTCAWADPETGIVFIFLSNRVYPNAENGLINRLDVRTKTQEYIYRALGVVN